MNNREIDSLVNARTKVELLKRTISIRNTITGTFSPLNPNRESELSELNNTFFQVAKKLPRPSKRDTSKIYSLIKKANDTEGLKSITDYLFEACQNETDLSKIVSECSKKWKRSEKIKAEVEAEVREISRRLPKYINRDEMAIAAGQTIEVLLRLLNFQWAIRNDKDIVSRYLNEACNYLPNGMGNLLFEASKLFAHDTTLLICMRHPSSSGEEFFNLDKDDERRPVSITIRRLANGTFQADHASNRRGTYGYLVDGIRRSKIKHLKNKDTALSYIRSLGENHWYTNFIRPNTELSKAPRYQYPQSKYRTFISWEELAKQTAEIYDRPKNGKVRITQVSLSY